MKMLIGFYLACDQCRTTKEDFIGIFDDDNILNEAEQEYLKNHAWTRCGTSVIDVETNMVIRGSDQKIQPTKSEVVMSMPSDEKNSLERDAARYRWLKENARQEGRDGGYVQLYTFPFVIKQSYPDVNYGDLDEAIDAELAKK